MKKNIFLGMLLCMIASPLSAQQLAFPGAEGFGKYAVGGRYGSVYHVTNLNDSGAGSLRDAVSQPNRIVVFDVAGVIRLQSRLTFKNNLYVAGQTAPGEGITVYGNGVSFSGADNTIVRYLRFRMGVVGDSGKDAAGVSNGTNMIFDHLSVSWGRDETFSISSDGKGDLGNITIQNSIIAQGLQTHCAGGLVQADRITLYRNLYVDNDTRNAKIKGRNQYVNNIVYNWSSGCFIMGGDSEGTHYANAQSNLFINGPSGGGNAFSGANSDFHIYAIDNWQDRDKDGIFDPYEIPKNEYGGGPTFITSPMDAYDLPIVSATTLLDESLPTVGASIPYRDYVDWYVLDEVLSLGKKGAFISRESSLPFGAPDSWNLWAGTKQQDSDNDGMPDVWEVANGTNADKNDAMVIADNGYANIENYINSITVDDRQFYLRSPLCLEAVASEQHSLTLGWLNYTEGEDGFVVEMKKEGVFVEIGRTELNVSTFMVEGLQPGTAYVFRIRAFAGDQYSGYSSEVTIKTRPLPTEMIDISTYVPDYTWTSGTGIWDMESLQWNDNTAAYINNSKVLIAPTSDAILTLDTIVMPDVVVVNSDSLVNIKGTGAINGSGSINKAGKGKLILGTTNSYKGATVLYGGTIELSSLKDASQPSSIGASEEFAQNWIWSGGTWLYSGGSTSTNRSAKLYEATEFNISNSSATVSMNGALEGEGDFILGGRGKLSVAHTKYFGHTGKTILKGGTLYLSTVDAAKAGIGSSSLLVLAGGTLQTKGESSNYETYSFPIEVKEGTVSQFSPNRNCYIKSKVTGSGTIQINIPYLREYIQGDWSGFTGRIIANGVNSNSSEGSLFLLNGNDNDFPNAVVELRGNAHLAGWSTNCEFEIGGISGASGTYIRGSSKNTAGFTCSYTVGGAGTDETFNGIINNLASSSAKEGTVSIKKVGTGDWRLTGNNTYKGTTTISGGRLIINGTHTGAGAITVNDGATLCGVGKVAGKVTVNAGGMLAVGDTLFNRSDVFTVSGGATIRAGAIVQVSLSRPILMNHASKIKFGGTTTIKDAILQLDMTNIATGLVDNSSFTIFDIASATSFKGNFKEIIPAVPAEGFVWDTSSLFTNGKLYVRKADNSIAIEETDIVKVSDLVDDELYIEVPTSARVTIYSASGFKMEVRDLEKLGMTWNVAKYPSGMYIVAIEMEGKHQTHRFLKR
ncbi:MAG: autotransporter-associated beta strand repeat-containing protein [Bacteroidaceae bacterium]|nr:autotransporter-associated beta strand repeat-containing protein [Bacteroidaceae bacterium]